jgi:hypothetical protein
VLDKNWRYTYFGELAAPFTAGGGAGSRLATAKFCRGILAPAIPLTSVYRLRWSEFRVFENAQSVTSGRQFEEILIFPHEIQQNVTRVDAEQKEKKEDPFSNNAYCQEHRHKSESTNASSD